MLLNSSPFAATAAFVFAAPLLTVSAMAHGAHQDMPKDEPAPEAQAEAQPQTSETQEQSAPAPASDAPAAQEEAKEEERICRRIRTDMSSRRATRVCLTRDEWRELNRGS